ncbi:MAG: PqqD family protein [Candidatus Omnitrophota bacterium]
MNKWNKVYRKNEDIVSREIDNELILMPIYKTNKDINEMYTLNETAGDMWDCIDGETTLGEIRDELCAHFKDVTREKLEADLEEFIADMKKIKAIK